MKICFKIWTPSTALRASLGLIAVIAVSACGPAIPNSTAIPADALLVPATSTPMSLAPTSTDGIAATPTPIVMVLPVATSRGPNLEATDPTTVSLASGGLQLIEFFRFT